MNPSIKEMMALSIPLVAILGGLLMGMVGFIATAMSKVRIARAKEESRREIAAYVAEGSITPDDAIRMLEAGGSLGDVLKKKINGL